MQNKLTIETIEAVIKELEQKRQEYEHEVELGAYKFKFFKRDILKGTQVIIKSGNNIYYSPDFKSGDVMIIEAPEVKIVHNYTDFTTIPYS